MEVKIPGIGTKTEKLFDKLNLTTLDAMAVYYPMRYIQYDAPVYVREANIGDTVAIKGRISKSLQYYPKVIRGQCVDDEGMVLDLVWFHKPYNDAMFRPGAVFVFYGKVDEYNGYKKIVQPLTYTLETYQGFMRHMQPVYKTTGKLSQSTLQNAILYAVDNCDYPEIIPAQLREKRGLIGKADAMEIIHCPKNKDDLEAAQRRIKYEDFFDFLMQVTLSRTDRVKGPTMREHGISDSLVSSLPFTLTNAQLQAWEQIKRDMSSEYRMKRLVQGDVGSGKTIISFLSLLMAAENGYQSVLMAPTEVLAKQHYEDMVDLLEKNHLDITCTCLCGSTQKKAAEYKKIKSGETKIVIGTHAVIQEKVEYNNLGLAVIDEQHRFGVEQRRTLSKRSNNPHILIMSATPIPRSLGQVLYADLDISIVNELPANRKPIMNAVIEKNKRMSAWKMMYKQIQTGRQGYVICPMVEDNEKIEAESVKTYAEMMQRAFPDDVKIGILYGSMKAEEKNDVMQKFSENIYQILVSTTVIEVGVNVPNATVMLIENANMFGLSQLHQLRGRVGRGGYQSYCIFLNGSDSDCERLEIIGTSNDGFKIAEEDMRLRGMGDILGTEQSGTMKFALADIYEDKDIMAAAKEDVEELLKADPTLSNHPKLKCRYEGKH